MSRITSIRTEPGYQIKVAFGDGLTGTLDLSGELWGPIFEPLRDPEFFARAELDEFGVISWPNGADLAPEFVYGAISGQSAELSRG